MSEPSEVDAEASGVVPHSSAFDAFVSYSHAADGLLAPRLQSALQSFAKPWWRKRAVRVFRDQSSLSANPHLWASITDALSSSSWFVLLLSPEAARSEWVGREISWWREHRSPDRILPVVTDGELVWAESSRDLDPLRTTCAPGPLFGAFSDEPRWVDLRWAKTDTQLHLRNSRFRDAVADLASALRGVPKDELESEEVRRHRGAVRTAWAAATSLFILTVIAVGSTLYAQDQRRLAEDQARIATARSLSANSSLIAGRQLDTSLLLAVEAMRTSADPPSQASLFTALNAAQHLVGPRPELGKGVSGMATSADASRLAVIDNSGTITIWDTVTWKVVAGPFGDLPWFNNLQLSTNGERLLVSTDTGIEIWDATNGTLVAVHAGQGLPLIAGMTPDGRHLLSTPAGGSGRIDMWDIDSGDRVASLPTPGRVFGDRLAISPDGTKVAMSSNGLTVMAIPSGEVLGSFASSQETIAWSSTGDLIAGGNPAGVVIIDFERGDVIAEGLLSNGAAASLAFAPQSDRLAVTTISGQTVVFEVDNIGEIVESANLSTSPGASLAWLSTDRLLTGSDSATEWDLGRPTLLGQGLQTERIARSLVSVADDEFIVADSVGVSRTDSSGNVTILIDDWDCRDLSRSSSGRFVTGLCGQRLEGPASASFVWDRAFVYDVAAGSISNRMEFGEAIEAVTVSGDDRLLVGVAIDAILTMGLDDLAKTRIQTDQSLVSAEHGGALPRFVPALNKVVATSLGGKLFLVDIATGESDSHQVVPDDWVDSFTVDPAGERVFLASASGIRSFDPVTLTTSTIETAGERWHELKSDGHLLIGAGPDGLHIWDLESGHRLARSLRSHRQSMTALDLNGGTVITAGVDKSNVDDEVGSIVHWKFEPQTMTDTACQVVGRNLSATEWARYLPGIEYRSTCPQYPPG
ncbi:MAG TPA: TIR domain-containing protein [Acidimicrobiia bacterium]|nr:TIR domain-containing protein [Acidimicrobiia bacterium]